MTEVRYTQGFRITQETQEDREQRIRDFVDNFPKLRQIDRDPGKRLDTFSWGSVATTQTEPETTADQLTDAMREFTKKVAMGFEIHGQSVLLGATQIPLSDLYDREPPLRFTKEQVENMTLAPVEAWPKPIGFPEYAKHVWDDAESRGVELKHPWLGLPVEFPIWPMRPSYHAVFDDTPIYKRKPVGRRRAILDDRRWRECRKRGVPFVTEKSAYDIAVECGFHGTEQEWLDSLMRV